MALFRFRTRSPKRGSDTDADRLQRLRQSLADIRAEMERERNGLSDRYDQVMADAVFSQQLVEDERGGTEISSTVDDLTGTMTRHTRRLAALQDQLHFVSDIDRQVDAFSPIRQAASSSIARHQFRLS